ncbi:isopentenyldiphosphate isomerase [Eubacterium sp. CAG:786]|nr:isopentenyldiphosphate isomerase [Eubacterium sp. CAG:786]
MTEYFDLYTADRRRLGRKIQRGAPIPHGEYHIVVQIMTVNSRGEILLTQRVPQKTSGGRRAPKAQRRPVGMQRRLRDKR